MHTLPIQTNDKFELVNVTREINQLIAKAKATSGLAIVYVPHTTAGLICNENESRLKSDILNVLKTFKREVGKAIDGFTHDPGEGNAHAHIINSISEGARVFIVENQQLVLGTWQQVMFLEMDGPRSRQVLVKIIPDKKLQ